MQSVYSTALANWMGQIVDFAFPVDQRKGKERQVLTLCQKIFKNPWNMMVMVIPVVNGALGTITKGLVRGVEELEIRGRAETIQTTALLRSAKIVRRFLKTWGDLLLLILHIGVKKIPRSNIKMIFGIV